MFQMQIEAIDREIDRLFAQRRWVVAQAVGEQSRTPGSARLVALSEETRSNTRLKIDCIKKVRDCQPLYGLKGARDGVEGVMDGTPLLLGVVSERSLMDLRTLGCTVEVIE